MTDLETAEAGVRAIAREIGVEIDAAQAVSYAVFLVSTFRGKSWDEAKAEGLAAGLKIRTEDDAERARRERLADR